MHPPASGASVLGGAGVGMMGTLVATHRRPISTVDAAPNTDVEPRGSVWRYEAVKSDLTDLRAEHTRASISDLFSASITRTSSSFEVFAASPVHVTQTKHNLNA